VLVTPVWNDSARLARFGPTLAEALRDSGLPIQWIVADDGSSQREKASLGELVEGFQRLYPKVEAMLCDERSRKGGAIYRAWDANVEAGWLGFVDADGAINAGSVLRLIREAMDEGPDGACVGVRHHAADTPVKRGPWRLFAFRTFTVLVRLFSGLRFEDTQCGAKVIPGKGYRAVRASLGEFGYVFDVELLVALGRRGFRIREMAIPWREVAGSKVRPWRDAWPMLAGLWRIRRRIREGHYD